MLTNPISLLELNGYIKDTLKKGLQSFYWIIGEISELKVNASGHCYLDLVEKDEKESLLIAKNRATIWATNFRMIRPYFETTTGTKLSAGIKILVKVVVEYHELYGLNLNIVDIEPFFTVGELARRKQEIIIRLTEEGVIDMNKELAFPGLPKKIAVISSKTAAGYGDFCDQLEKNPYNYKFYLKLFPAYMQGDEAEQSIIAALEKINEYDDFFDVVVIIRGGGSQADLDCFNNYLISLHIAQFPVPVLTGIGHEQDETIADLVAHTRLKTPTAVAEYLIDRYHEEELMLDSFINEISSFAGNRILTEKEKLLKIGISISSGTRRKIEKYNLFIERAKLQTDNLVKNFISARNLQVRQFQYKSGILFEKTLNRESEKVKYLNEFLKKFIGYYLSGKKLQLENIENKNLYLDPAEVLKRGYSITRFKNKAVKSASDIKPDDTLESIFYDGRVFSKVLK